MYEGVDGALGAGACDNLSSSNDVSSSFSCKTTGWKENVRRKLIVKVDQEIASGCDDKKTRARSDEAARFATFVFRCAPASDAPPAARDCRIPRTSASTSEFYQPQSHPTTRPQLSTTSKDSAVRIRKPICTHSAANGSPAGRCQNTQHSELADTAGYRC